MTNLNDNFIERMSAISDKINLININDNSYSKLNELIVNIENYIETLPIDNEKYYNETRICNNNNKIMKQLFPYYWLFCEMNK
jgi:hypothetical protein